MIRSGNSNVCGKTLPFSAVTRVPVRAAVAAPKAKAISFSQLTGMPISSAASESSRNDRHARPVRDSFTNRSAMNTTTKTASAT